MAYSWSQPISLRGPQGLAGAAGVSFTQTNGKPTVTGQTGEMRLDPAAFVIWSWMGSDWTPSQSFKGVAGMAGPVDYFGVGNAAPDSTTYSGDGQGFFILKPSAEVYLYNKQQGWYDAGYSLKGDTGDVGPVGRRGSVLFEGQGPPPSDPSTLTVGDVTGALPGDTYRDTSNGDVKEYYFS